MFFRARTNSPPVSMDRHLPVLGEPVISSQIHQRNLPQSLLWSKFQQKLDAQLVGTRKTT